MVVVVEPHPPSIQNRDGGGPLLQASRGIFPFIKWVLTNSGSKAKVGDHLVPGNKGT
jgi:hypothetical protein